MMQQPGPQEHLGGQQQASQQMMLCPVRLVYETQILVQPGDQIQPNQTIFLNQQNLPPWIQNRTMPNQVIYVQQLPSNNFMPSIQQMDQNQMYIPQNFTNYPQIMPNQIMSPNNQEQIRSQMQISNVMPHLLQNSQNNVVSNVTNMPSERVLAQTLTNYTTIGSNPGTNLPNSGQNIISVGPNSERQIVTNIQTTPQVFSQSLANTVTYQNPQELQNLRHQNSIQRSFDAQVMQQQANIVRAQNTPQVMAVNPIQNMANIPQRPPNVSHAVGTNIRHMLQAHNVMKNVSQANPTSSISTPVNTQRGIFSNKVILSNPVNKTNNMQPILMNTTPKNHGQTYRPPYRPIQPRPQVYANHSSNFIPESAQVNQMLGQIQNPARETTPKQIAYTNNTPSPIPAYVKNNDNTTQVNRKRKSESPDEIYRKVVINSLTLANDTKCTVKTENNPIPNYINRTNEIGVNTSPVHKPVEKLKTKINPVKIEAGNVVNHETQKPVNIVQTLPDLGPEFPKIKDVTQQIKEEKLFRNTVFTQARGRQHNDKVVENNTTTNADTKADVAEKKESFIEMVEKTEENKEKLTINMLQTVKTENVIKETKSNNVDIKQEECAAKLENIQADVTDRKNKILTFDDMKGKEICVIDGNVRKEIRDSFLLTHVLDGYVIQESNIAFPIRRPLQEKTITNLQMTTTDSENPDQKQEYTSDKAKKEDPIKDNSKILNISHLNLADLRTDNLNGERECEGKVDDDKVNPFGNVKHEAVKKWTVDELGAHLEKYQWNETTLVLREHEIDGDALFLVSKPQLVTIGIEETHADIICDFVKS